MAAQMTAQQRELAMAYAKYAAGQIPNGPTAGNLFRASRGEGDGDLLLAIHYIIDCHESNKAQHAAIA